MLEQISTHTKGPWYVSTDTDEPDVVCELHTSGLAHFLIVPSAENELGDIFADARLIAATPCLLAALEELRDWYERYTGLPACNANSAIAKALGSRSNAAFSRPPARDE